MHDGRPTVSVPTRCYRASTTNGTNYESTSDMHLDKSDNEKKVGRGALNPLSPRVTEGAMQGCLCLW
jgi:hypothetical protein